MGQTFKADPLLGKALTLWADTISGPGATRNVESGKWKFLTLPWSKQPSALDANSWIADAVGSDLDEVDSVSYEDERQRILASIVCRQGQPAFRKKLLEAYSGRCPVSGSDAEETLEAAHIHPYAGLQSNVLKNGILLRADLHTLFDLYLLSIDPEHHCALVHPSLRDGHYWGLNGRSTATPLFSSDWPREALKWHMTRCGFPAEG